MNPNDGTSLSPQQDSGIVTTPSQTAYPLFETLLRGCGHSLRPTYTCKDVALLFGVTARTIQSKVADGTLPSRNLIGGARFLPIDLETYLRDSQRPRAG